MIDATTGLERTFGDYNSRSGGFAASLKDMGIKEGGTVALLCPNHVDFASVAFGTVLNGAKLTPINPLYTVEEINTVIQRSGATVLVAHEWMLDSALKSAKDCNVKHVVVITNDPSQAVPEGTSTFESTCNHSSPFFKTIMEQHDATDKFPAILPYSSGTTGLPKGVCLSHSNIVSNMLQMENVEGPVIAPDDKFIGPLPFFHIYAFTVTMLYLARSGNTVITNSGRFDLEAFCQQVEKYRPVRSHLVPPIILGLAKHPVVGKYDMSSLNMVTSAAAPLGKDTETEFTKRLSINVKQGWGLSETSPLGCIAPDGKVKPGSIGPPVASTLIKIIDPEGNSLGPEEEGELCIKGPQVMMGYLVCS